MNCRECHQGSLGLRVVYMLTGLALLAGTGLTHAAWVVEPTVQVDSSYDDNIGLRSDDEDDQEAGLVSSARLQARLRNVTEISEISAILGAAFSRYSGVDSFEDDSSETFFASLNASRLLERGSLGLTGTYRRDDVLRGVNVLRGAPTEVSQDPDAPPPEPDPDENVETGADPVTGSSRQPAQRNYLSVNPRYTWQATQRSAVVMSYAFSDQSFESDDPADGYEDSQSHSGAVQLQRVFTERDTGWIEVQRSWFDPEFSTESDTWGVTANWQRQLTERMRLALGAGGQRTENEIDSESGVLFNARLDRSLERGSLNASVQRTMMPNGYGEVVEADRLTLGFTRGITERVSTSLRLSGSSTDRGLGGQDDQRQDDRSQDYFQVRPEVRWAFSEQWALSAAYIYTWVDREQDTGSAASNAVMLGVSYAPPRRL